MAAKAAPRKTATASKKATPSRREGSKKKSVRVAAVGDSGAGDQPAGSVRIRHYCQGIGDCHLIRFQKDDGNPFFMLIDCGVHTSVAGGPKKIERIVEDIEKVTKRIDVVVVTHEHWDHVSGFLTESERFSRLKIGQVWMGWTENPADPQARQLDKYKELALSALQAASQRLALSPRLDGHLPAVSSGLESLMGFNFGAKGERVRTARDAAGGLAKNGVRYLEPGSKPIGLTGVPNIRTYVLGPPRDSKLLGVTERPSEMYGILGAAGVMAMSLRNGIAISHQECSNEDDPSAPFDANVGSPLSEVLGTGVAGAEPVSAHLQAFVATHYAGPASSRHATAGAKSSSKSADSQDWRRIDNDWLGVSADLAMQLDHRTNNTSLVLAFEFVDTGRVLLFAADAQVGSWLSWQDLAWNAGGESVTGPELLARTVYYKVAHHGSPNATLKEKGLELMSSPDLSAFVPTNGEDALKVKWGKIPFKGILNALDDRAQGRVTRADDRWISSPNGRPNFEVPSGSILSVRHEPDLWVEFDVA